MLSIYGPANRFCDGLSRRRFLTLGGLALGGLSLPEVLRAEAASGSSALTRGAHKSTIMVYLSGGLAHQDSFDLKPNAPAEVRGEFRPISTSVPGIEVCELLPRLAQRMERLAVIRSIVGLRDEHTSFQNLTGYPMDLSLRDGKPNFGSVIARVQGAADEIMPPFVDLFPTMQHRPYNSARAGLLGRTYDGVKADGDDLSNMTLRGISLDRLGDRRQLLGSFNAFRRQVEAQELTGVDASYRRAFDVLTSRRLLDAFNLDREDPRLRDRYGRGSSAHQGDGAPLWNDQLLLARRLVEAGVRCVTVAYGFWDTHGNNFNHLRGNLPVFDQGIAALVDDLHEHGLDRDTTVVVWGEFGRTPKINKDAGRDHWPRVSGALLFGGGLRTGQVIGSTDKLAGAAVERPVHYQDVLATIYQRMGIDHHLTLPDRADRPTPLLPDTAQPIAELV
ncbi:MAG: DUF1501 domain-containing protein [Pirellulales bacterium]|nr:DUF1501 domain-containing protein [Pirellulales bacterium]